MPRCKDLGLFAWKYEKLGFVPVPPAFLGVSLSVVCDWPEAKLGCPHVPSGCRYEEEINRRTAAENEFVLLKKVRGRGTGGCLIPRVVPGSLGPLYPRTRSVVKACL